MRVAHGPGVKEAVRGWPSEEYGARGARRKEGEEKLMVRRAEGEVERGR